MSNEHNTEENKVDIKKLTAEIFDAETLNDKASVRNFIKEYAPREERHYCAYLFAWLLASAENIKTFFSKHTNAAEITFGLTIVDYEKCKLYFEYTGIRELIDLVGRNYQMKKHKNELKILIEKEIFINKKGDIQKKKPDLVFYFPAKKRLILTEAKFEMEFDEDQFAQTLKYGKILKLMYPEDIEVIKMTLLGRNYFTEELADNYPSITWESLSTLIETKSIKEEIIKGLNYQIKIHPRTIKTRIKKDNSNK